MIETEHIDMGWVSLSTWMDFYSAVLTAMFTLGEWFRDSHWDTGQEPHDSTDIHQKSQICERL